MRIDETLRIGYRACDVNVIALCPQEVLGEVRGVRITLDEQDSPLGGLVSVGTESRIAGGEPLRECPMRVRGAQSERHLLAHEPELVELVAGVQALRSRAPLGHHDAVTVFPRPQRRR